MGASLRLWEQGWQGMLPGGCSACPLLQEGSVCLLSSRFNFCFYSKEVRPRPDLFNSNRNFGEIATAWFCTGLDAAPNGCASFQPYPEQQNRYNAPGSASRWRMWPPLMCQGRRSWESNGEPAGTAIRTQNLHSSSLIQTHTSSVLLSPGLPQQSSSSPIAAALRGCQSIGGPPDWAQALAWSQPQSPGSFSWSLKRLD